MESFFSVLFFVIVLLLIGFFAGYFAGENDAMKGIKRQTMSFEEYQTLYSLVKSEKEVLVQNIFNQEFSEKLAMTVYESLLVKGLLFVDTGIPGGAFVVSDLGKKAINEITFPGIKKVGE